MIIVMNESGMSLSCRELFTTLDPDCREFAYGEKTVAELTELNPDLIILHHEKAIQQCRNLRVKGAPHLRILIILEQEHAADAVAGRIAGADSCLIAPLGGDVLLHAAGNEYAAASRWKAGERFAAEKPVINNRYQLTGLLGVGLRANVYLGKDTETGKTVSIKLLRNMLLKQTDLLNEFIMEGKKLTAFHSPFMVEILEIGSWNGVPFLVMDIGRAQNLYQYLAQNKFNEIELEKFALDMIRAMIALKHFKLLHMNIKPENILFFNGKFLLSEFGLLTPVTAPLDNSCFHYWGDAAFTSPEFYSPNAELCARSDVYSLGILLYTIACRKNPFAGYYHRTIETKHFQPHAIRAQNACPTYCSAFKITLDAMLQLNIQARPRLRELEVIFSQSIALHSGGNQGEEQLGNVALFTDKKSGIASTSQDAEAGDDSTIMKVRKDQTDQTVPLEVQKMMNRYDRWKRAGIMILLAAAALILSLLMFAWGKAERPPVYFRQGQKMLFTCYSGHTHAIRTLDFRTVRCPECKDRTSLSYTCKQCRRIFGTSLWPLRDMTEQECEAFEKKLNLCPFCKSPEIEPTKPLPAPKPGTAGKEKKQTVRKK